MKVAVTCATGHLGRAILKALGEFLPQEQIIGLARSPEKGVDLGLEIRPGDYNDSGALRASLKGIDVVLMISGMDAPDKRIQQHRNVIEAAKINRVGKIVYTSIQGADEGTAFSPIVASNRQTEEDIRASGLDYVIGRNGIYIEPDVAYMDTYIEMGGIYNSAGDGLCGYTTREALAYAYAKLIIENKHVGKTYNLHGQSMTQSDLAKYLSQAFEVDLTYHEMTVEAYKQERIGALGEFLGNVIAGIYEGIRLGAANNPSDYFEAAGREHIGWKAYFEQLKKS